MLNNAFFALCTMALTKNVSKRNSKKVGMLRVDPSWEQVGEGETFWMNVAFPPSWEMVFGTIRCSNGWVLSNNQVMDRLFYLTTKLQQPLN